MKKIFKILGFVFSGLIALVVVAYLFITIRAYWNYREYTSLLYAEAPLLVVNQDTVRDLNKNGKVDIYENPNAPITQRIDDLLKQMTLEEKAGLLFITMIAMEKDGSLNEGPSLTNHFSFFLEPTSSMVAGRNMNHFNIIDTIAPRRMLLWHNNLQKLAEKTRLGIPVTIASDPRHITENNIGAAIFTPFFSRWCSPLGFAAIDDTLLMRKFGEIARNEYKAVGIRLALSPMADLATEPRWARIGGTFGEDAELSARLTKAYILGFQGDSLGKHSVACMTKHFSGGGPQKDGEDAHFTYGKDQAYPAGQFEYHLIPFEKGAFAANTAQIMPYYGVPVGQTNEDVGFGYNKEIITRLLREKYDFDGVVCTDWALISGSIFKPAADYGVEHLSDVEKAAKILNAGCDMFGGEFRVDLVVEAVKSGKVTEERLNKSVRRVLLDKFRLGLFDDPYLKEEGISTIANKEFIQKGRETQRRSLTLLKNKNNTLPLKQKYKIYLEGFRSDLQDKTYMQLVKDPKEADFIIMRLMTPFTPRSEYRLERFFHQGDLDFKGERLANILDLINTKPTITIISMDRPAVIPEINTASEAVIADFGSEEDIILDLIFGNFSPSGKLPFEMPASMEAVRQQAEDAPYDSQNPLYRFGHGLTYRNSETDTVTVNMERQPE